jgi:hypothetical protein
MQQPVNGVALGWRKMKAFTVGKKVANTNDPYFSNVVLLCHFEGANNSTTFIDSSSYNRTATVAGNAKISTTNPLTGTSSGVFDGSTATKLSWANSSDFAFGSGDFTIELLVKLNAYTNTGLAALISKILAGTGAGRSTLQFFFVGVANTSWTALTLFLCDTSNAEHTYSVTFGFELNTTYLIGISRESGVLKIAINNTVVLTASANFALKVTTAAFAVACNSDATSTAPYPCPCYLDELRVTKGVARDLTIAQTLPFLDF